LNALTELSHTYTKIILFSSEYLPLQLIPDTAQHAPVSLDNSECYCLKFVDHCLKNTAPCHLYQMKDINIASSEVSQCYGPSVLEIYF